MAYSLSWLPDVLLAAGLKVAEVPGWRDRGCGDAGETFGILCHHTAGPVSGNMPSLQVVIDGRPDLRGPLAQLALGRDGTYYVIAAGKANHAGRGIWAGVTDGNAHFIGIEAENTGLPNDRWPVIQMDAYQRGVAAILKNARLDSERCAGHKEYALPQGRKSDPSFDMHVFRTEVARLLNGSAPAPIPIPVAEQAKPNASARPTIRRGTSNELVAVVQNALFLQATGLFDAQTEAKVREFQRKSGLVPDGIVGPASWAALDRLARAA